MNSSEIPLFTLNENFDEIVFSLIYANVSFPLLPLYFLVMLVSSPLIQTFIFMFHQTLYLKDQKQANMTYRLMNVCNFFEVGQAVGHFVSSPILLFPMMQVRFDVLIRVGSNFLCISM